MRIYKTRYQYLKDTGGSEWLEVINPYEEGQPPVDRIPLPGLVVHDGTPLYDDGPLYDKECFRLMAQTPWELISPIIHMKFDECLVTLRDGWILPHSSFGIGPQKL